MNLAIGRLIISVFNETEAIPVENAQIAISPTNRSGIVVSEITTDISGKTRIIELQAPRKEYSMEPSTIKPYSEYDLTVKHENFDTVTIRKIQILPDVLSEEKVFLKVLKEGTSKNVNYSIQDHVLYGKYPKKIPEDEVKQPSSAANFVILEEVVVPEFIIVHDGLPTNSYVTNYWVEYKDYIKNVASSEIYPTWPYECIKANILAINSFTLNRVYTEWYRSRGYNFTITSSTAYDQKFIYQRNVFQEISNVVDEVFSNYITKPNISQPLFTQYCDGKQVSCPGWLTQWGSKYLADEGYNYMEILRNFYGPEIYLASAEKIAGVPVSYPGSTLQNGSTGSSVRVIQEQLNTISKAYPAIPKIAVDGIYGPKTTESVKKFQQIFDLSQTGSVDYPTWYEISKIFVAIEKIS
ncbi:MAG: peptidoglycan-binding protein [Candidatus Paraimprobicoccus trichonymphae]|uniref:Peptidoglycan-binding protein n=1 Tax=Candidatus Paraimprobicoccus trichonymphae TaxID=3033793 RepID=A0AA48I491_9FIRM|nr:MAG: peptidoglycan-binding protein [Candidatus Paraimprobicoccus trichonymphae]